MNVAVPSDHSVHYSAIKVLSWSFKVCTSSW